MSEITDIKIEDKGNKLSASKIKTFEACSWQYLCQYHLRLPRYSRSYFDRGTVVHSVLEFLLKPRHKHHYNIIKEAKSVHACPAIDRYVKMACKRYNLNNIEEFDLICSMILGGLDDDFYCDTFDKLTSEEEFDIKGDGYWIGGYIDKKAENEKEIVIYDYKTSKSKFTEKDIDWNIQALVYTLAVWIQTKKIPKIVFKFVRFPKDSSQEMPQCTEEQLRGFEEYLKYITNQMKSFTLNEAQSNLAANTDARWMSCGRCNDKDEFLSDPSKHCCIYKFDFYYYELFEGEKSIARSFDKKDLKQKENQIIKKRYYKGCPAFRK